MGTSPTAAGRKAGDSDGFVAFFRRYTRTWIHGVSTAGLTGFGMLTFVHRWFAALAIASYVVPPIGLYLASGLDGGESSNPDNDASETPSPPSGDADRAQSDPLEGEAALEDGPAAADEPTGEESAGSDEPEGGDEPDSNREPRWLAVDSPTDGALFDVALTKGGTVAAGGDGVVIASDGEGWTTLLEDGPGANGESLSGIDSTEDGAIAWVAGDNGAIGRLETEVGRHVDYSAPKGLTDNLTGVAVSGVEGDETVLVINGSGEILRGRYREGEVAWEGPTKPGSGSSLADVALAGDVGYCCDTNGGVFESDDGGRTFEAVGLEGADGTLTALAPAGRADCLVATDAGVVHRYDGTAWTPERVGEEALTGIARAGEGVAVCDGSGGVRVRSDPTADWRRAATSAAGSLRGIALDGDRGVAVGDGGTVLERDRPRSEPDSGGTQ